MTISQLPDLQSEVPSVPLSIDRIGSQSIRRYVSLLEAPHATRVLISCFMDVPNSSRGAHVSRIITAIDQAIDQQQKTLTSLSMLEFCQDILYSLMTLHNQSTRYSVQIEGEVVATRTNRVNGGISIKPYEMLGEIRSEDGVKSSRMGVRTKICMACPQAQAVIQHNVTSKLGIAFNAEQIALIEELVPLPSHNQLGIAEIWIEIPNSLSEVPTFDALLDLIEESVSSPTYEYLKRRDEGAAVEELHRKPRFVEEAIREFYQRFCAKFPQLPDSTEIEVTIVNYESTFEYALEAHSIKRLGIIQKVCIYTVSGIRESV